MAIKIVSVTTETCDICKKLTSKNGYAVFTSTDYIKLGNNSRYDNVCKTCSANIHKFIKQKLLNSKKK
jgi:hypothetical protein